MEEAGEKYEVMYWDYTSYLVVGIGFVGVLLLQLMTILEMYVYDQ